MNKPEKKTVAEAANATLFPRTESWYSGANISGKRRQFVVHLGGQDYFKTLGDVAANGYEGFVTAPTNQSVESA